MTTDLICKQCGEPYTAYSLRHEIPTWEDQPDDAYEKFMAGEGCPTCEWGDKAGEVSVSRTASRQELESHHFESLFRSDDDPAKYL